MIHELADVQSKNIGKNTRIWQFTVILSDAIIGENCNICSQVFVENNVKIGDRVTIKNGVQLWEGTRIEDEAFIGPNVTFTNDMYPRSKKEFELKTTTIGKNASIGANSTILAGISVGNFAMIGAGSVITKPVADFQLWYGAPAEHKGYVTKEGESIDLKGFNKQNEPFFFNGDNWVKK